MQRRPETKRLALIKIDNEVLLNFFQAPEGVSVVSVSPDWMARCITLMVEGEMFAEVPDNTYPPTVVCDGMVDYDKETQRPTITLKFRWPIETKGE